MANAPVKIWGKFSQYALQILDFTLNMPHEILGPVAPSPPPPPTLKDPEYLPGTLPFSCATSLKF